jgi:hypothetical protein
MTEPNRLTIPSFWVDLPAATDRDESFIIVLDLYLRGRRPIAIGARRIPLPRAGVGGALGARLDDGA